MLSEPHIGERLNPPVVKSIVRPTAQGRIAPTSLLSSTPRSCHLPCGSSEYADLRVMNPSSPIPKTPYRHRLQKSVFSSLQWLCHRETPRAVEHGLLRAV